MNKNTILLTTNEAITLAAGNLLVSMGRVYELAKLFTGEDLYTHQLIRFGKEAEYRLQDDCRDLIEFVKANPITRENWQDVSKKAEIAFGAEKLWETKSWDDWMHMDPLTELADICPGKPICTVEVEKGSE